MNIPFFLSGSALAPIVATIIRFLVGTFFTRIVSALGISIVTFNITSSIGNMMKNYFASLISSTAGGEVMSIAKAMGVSSAANIIFSAYIGALAIRAAMSVANRLTFGNASGGN